MSMPMPMPAPCGAGKVASTCGPLCSLTLSSLSAAEPPPSPISLRSILTCALNTRQNSYFSSPSSPPLPSWSEESPSSSLSSWLLANSRSVATNASFRYANEKSLVMPAMASHSLLGNSIFFLSFSLPLQYCAVFRQLHSPACLICLPLTILGSFVPVWQWE